MNNVPNITISDRSATVHFTNNIDASFPLKQVIGAEGTRVPPQIAAQLIHQLYEAEKLKSSDRIKKVTIVVGQGGYEMIVRRKGQNSVLHWIASDNVDRPSDNTPMAPKKQGLLSKALSRFKFKQNEPIRRFTSELFRIVEALPPKVSRVVERKLTKITNDEAYLAEYISDRFDIEAWQRENPGINLVSEILRGAYIQIDDGGTTYQDWKDNLESKKERVSSHESSDPQYAIRGPIVTECLFSQKQVEENGQTKTMSWFQLERYPAKAGYHIRHLWTWALYRATGDNQGPHGASPHTERVNPITLTLRTTPRS